MQGFTTRLGLKDFVLASTNLLHMYCVYSSLKDAKSFFTKMPEKNIVSWNVMLNGYSKARYVNLARDLFDKIPEKDVVSWGTMVDAYVQMARLYEALTMLSAGVRPTDVMIVDLALGCRRVMVIGESQQLHATIVKTVFNCYDFVQSTILHFYSSCGKINLACLQFGVAIKHYGCMVDLLGRAGRLQEVEAIIRNMPMEADVIWGTLLAACRTQCNVDIGERAAKRRKSLDTLHGASRVLLYNLYAGRWNDVIGVRKEMQGEIMVRSPGATFA